MITFPSELKPIAKKVDVKLTLVYKTILILAITNILFRLHYEFY